MTVQRILLAFALAVPFAATTGAQVAATAQVPAVPTTHILAIGRLTAGTDRKTIAPVMDQEVRDTLRLYLAGKIDQWYFRTDKAGGVVFILNVSTVEEARALLEKLPLGQAKFMEFDLIPLGPLSPLNMLLQDKSVAPAR